MSKRPHGEVYFLAKTAKKIEDETIGLLFHLANDVYRLGMALAWCAPFEGFMLRLLLRVRCWSRLRNVYVCELCVTEPKRRLGYPQASHPDISKPKKRTTPMIKFTQVRSDDFQVNDA